MDLRPNLLIVDDYRENLLLLETLIKRLNVNIITANSGADALEKTRDVELALAIIDVRMPAMNGYELAMKMNERINDKVPVIFLTASHFNEIEMFKGYGFGAVDYIFKPIDNNFLLSKINVFLDLFKQKQTIRSEAEILKNYASELMRVNSALKQSEEKYRTMLNASPDGILVIDQKGYVLEVSEVGMELFGFSDRDDLIGKKLASFVAKEDSKIVKVILEKTMAEGLTQNIGLRLNRKDQSIFPGELSATRLFGPDGVMVSVMITIRDISQRKKRKLSLCTPTGWSISEKWPPE